MLTDLGVEPYLSGGRWRFELAEEQVIWFSDAVRAYERERLARYLDRAAAGARATAATGLLSDEITANAWTEAAGWCRDKTIRSDQDEEEGLRADR
jgi:hypothetical protein